MREHGKNNKETSPERHTHKNVGKVVLFFWFPIGKQKKKTHEIPLHKMTIATKRKQRGKRTVSLVETEKKLGKTR